MGACVGVKGVRENWRGVGGGERKCVCVCGGGGWRGDLTVAQLQRIFHLQDVCVCVCACVCVCEEREREIGGGGRAREREGEMEGERERESVCVCVCVCAGVYLTVVFMQVSRKVLCLLFFISFYVT